jgi:predicted transcriptional regulator
VIADMFGLALRSYRQKVQRLTESATTRGVTLWSAVHAFLEEHGSATRVQLLMYFKHDEESTVRSILNDLVESGLVLRSGRGRSTRYRAATAEELKELGASAAANSQETNAALVWVHVYRESPLPKQKLAQLLPLPPDVLDEAIHSLVADGQIRVESRSDGVYYATDHCHIPVGQAAGWEAAIVDHHRAVLNALAAKVASGQHVSAAGDEVGGTTVTYDLWPGHPREQQVRALLATMRNQVIPLWEEISDYNRERMRDVSYHVTFYCGQYLMDEKESA